MTQAPFSFRRLLIANRGEIACRIARGAAELGLATVGIAPEDDLTALHTRRVDALQTLPGGGARAYLDIEAVIAAAKAAGCDAVHPGYGFLSENAVFAERCAEEGVIFVGPSPSALRLFGDKVAARALARRCDVPTPRGLFERTNLDEARAFFQQLGKGAAIILKAVAGGGGRGIRVVRNLADLASAYERCQSEATASFGNGDLYVEQYLPEARHLEVQIVADRHGGVTHLWERECSLQRRHQKIVEIAPSPTLDDGLRRALLDDSIRLAKAADYAMLGTFEFLVWRDEARGADDYAFIEANPRIQVEHTVTEEVTGVDLVKTQLRLAAGATLADVGLGGEGATPRGHAIQFRINAETMQPDGQVLPAAGRIETYDPPSGSGVRVDACGYAGYQVGSRYDSLIAKVIVHAPEPDFAAAIIRSRRALDEFRLTGLKTNLDFQRALLARPEVAANAVSTAFIDAHVGEITEAAARLAGCELHFAPSATPTATAATAAIEGDGEAIAAPLQGTIIGIKAREGDLVAAGAEIVLMEAMKMEHVIVAPVGGRITGFGAKMGDTVSEGAPLFWIDADEGAVAVESTAKAVDLDRIRPDLAELLERRTFTQDANRPDAVARRRKRNQRTARENIEAVCDPESFMEYGNLVVAAQRARRSFDDLVKNTPADGIVTGIGSVNGEAFGHDKSRCVMLAYDATVLAATQGRESHRKDSRMFDLASRMRLPLVFFAEGGGGRPGDTERPGENMSFHQLPALSGKVPLVGVAAGYCFAGNAAFLGVCDVIVATEASSIGMGGPAMVEGGGLGVFTADEIGPAPMHYKTGVVDILVKDEIEAAAAVKRYLSYFQGPVAPKAPRDQRLLRHVIPEDRRRAYKVRDVIEILADEDSVLELRGGFGLGVITALIRIEGRPVGIVANNPAHLGGAVDGDGADKGARFLQLCDAFNLPVVHLCDTPGIMVGPDAEKTALVRRSSRMLVAGANLSVPCFTIILRKAYGLGMVAMMGGAFKTPLFTVAWPTGEYGGMGLEGAVRLGYRAELEAIADPKARQAQYDKRLAAMYHEGKALQKSSSFDFDDVIDPADTRRWIVRGLQSAHAISAAPDRPRPTFVSPW